MHQSCWNLWTSQIQLSVLQLSLRLKLTWISWVLDLAKLAEEDPTFQVKTDEDSGQTLSQEWESCTLDIIIDRLKREFKVDVNQGVLLKYLIVRTLPLQLITEVYKKQSGGRGKFADIVVKIEPQDDQEKTGLSSLID